MLTLSRSWTRGRLDAGRGCRFLVAWALATVASTGVAPRVALSGDAAHVPGIQVDQPITFSVSGDAPYGDDEIPEVQQILDDHNLYSDAEFFVHVGDIFLGGIPCDEYRYEQMADMLETLAVPAFIVPGDNETKDCVDRTLAWTHWTTHLLGIDQRFCNAPGVERQGARPENFAFLRSGVLFAGIHLVGGANPDDLLQDDADWIAQQLADHTSVVRAAVIFAQAGPGDADLFFDQFEIAAQLFGKPILFVHGNGHEWVNDFPFDAGNVRRVQVDRLNEPPLHVTVTMASDTLNTFAFERDPWPAGTPPYNVAPCADAGPDKLISILQQAYLVGSGTDDGVPASPGQLTYSWGKVSGPGSVSFSNPNQSTTFASFGVIGTYTLRLRVSDGALTSEDRVHVSVTDGPPINDPPTGNDDGYTVAINAVLTVPAPGVLANDSDSNGDALAAVLTNNVSHGQLSLNPNGSLSYTPDFNWFGTDSFRYVADDGVFTSAATTVTIDVTPTTLTFGALDDAFVISDAPTENHGDAETLRLDQDDATYHSYIKFVVSGTGTAIHSAKLRLFVTNDSDDGGSIYRVPNLYPGTLNPWDETTLVWQNALPLQGTALSSLGAIDEDTWVEFDVTAAIVGDGTYSFGMRNNSTDSARFSSKEGDDPPQLVILTVPGGGNVNGTPQVGDDAYALDEDASLTRTTPGVLANDVDADGDPVSIVLQSDVTQGTLALQADGAFSYTPNANYNGTDSFTYVAHDNRGAQAAGSVTLTVNDVNDIPIGEPEAYSTAEDVPLVVAAPGVLANDSDVDGDALSVIVVAPPAAGSVDLALDGSFTYTPDIDAHGSDAFTYRVRDGHGGTQDVVVSLTVTPVEDAPVAQDDTYEASEDVPLAISAPGVLANDSDAEDDSLFVSVTTPPQNGTLTLVADGSFTYAPFANTHGVDTFRYRVTDGHGGSGEARVSLDVASVNDVPDGTDDSYSTPEDTVLAVSAPGVLANDNDVDGDTLTARLLTPPPRGTLVLQNDGSFSYAPEANDHGSVSFLYVADDGAGGSDTLAVSLDVQAVEDPPVAVDDAYASQEDVTLVLAAPGVLANDSDADGDALSVRVSLAPQHGSLDLAPDGSFSYVPDPDYAGSDAFEYTVSDPDGDTDAGRVTLDVAAMNDAPDGADDVYTTAEDVLLQVEPPGVLANDSDVDGDALSVRLDVAPVAGNLVLESDGSFTYTPHADTHGDDAFTYVVEDGVGGAQTRNVTLHVIAVNDAPVGADDAYAGSEDTPLTVAAPGVLANDSDVDGDALSVSLTDGPGLGTLALEPDGSFVYTPFENMNGADAFSYVVSDGAGGTDVRAVTLTIAALNDAPVGVDDAYSTLEDTALDVSAPGVLANDADVDADALKARVETPPVHGTLVLLDDGSFHYEPEPDFNGTDVFTYVVEDGAGGADTRSVALQVHMENDAPVSAADVFDATEDLVLEIAAPGVLGNDVDVDGDALSVSLSEMPNRGSVTLDANGSFVYMPEPDRNGEDAFSYIVSDGNGGIDRGQVTLRVAAVQDKPQPGSDAYPATEDVELTVAAPGVLSNDVDVDGDALSAELLSEAAHGSVSLEPSGAFSYTPDPDFNGSDSFTYAARDSAGGIEVATVDLSVAAVNDAPVAIQDDYATDEDAVLALTAPGLLGNDSDVDGDALAASLDTPPQHGTLSVEANGAFTYLPAPDYHGADSFTYVLSDDNGGTDRGTVMLTVAPVNDAPRVLSEVYAGDEDTPLVVSGAGVLANDTDVDGDALSVTLDDAPSHGTLDLQPTGGFTYSPAADYHGADAFTYRVADGRGAVQSGRATLNVRPVNDAPASSADAFATSEDVALEVPGPGVLGNDSDVDGDPLVAEVVTAPAHGSLVLADDGGFVYTPAADFHGSDAFTYAARDAELSSSTATVTIDVTAVNDPPHTSADAFAGVEDAPLQVSAPGVLANDADVDGDVLTAVLDAPPQHGSVTLAPDGSFVYVPEADFGGEDGFAYRAEDGVGGSTSAWVTLDVAAVNDAPVAVADDFTVDEDSALEVSAPGILGNDDDVEGDPMSAVLVRAPTHGTLDLRPDGSFTYTPEPQYFGIDDFAYAVEDGAGAGGSGIVSITVRAVNDAPVASDAAYGGSEDQELVVQAPGVLEAASDVDGDVLRAVLASPCAHGSVEVEVSGAFTYHPAPDFNGDDSFTVVVEDGQGGSDSATILLHVAPAQDAPQAQADAHETPEDVVLVVAPPGVLANDVDVDGDPVQVALASPPVHGSLELDADGGFRYTPAPDFNGSDTFSYTLTDGIDSDAASVVLTVLPRNDAPRVADDPYQTDEDTALSVAAPGVLSNDADVDGDALVAVLLQPPSHGDLTLRTDGSFHYVPKADFNGSDTFEYRADDGAGASGSGRVTLDVRATNDAPRSVAESFAVAEDAVLEIPAPGVLLNDTDVDGDALSATLGAPPSHGVLVLQADGAFQYTPHPDFHGSDSFTYAAHDGNGASSTTSVSIRVDAVNDAPAAADDAYTGSEDVVLVAAAPGVLGNDSDVDADVLVAELGTPTTHGTVVLLADGSFTYTPDADFSGSDAFGYLVRDGNGGTDEGVVQLTVSGVNDAPRVSDDAYGLDEDTTLHVDAPGVLGNDSDVEGDVIRVTLGREPTSGTLRLESDGSFGFVPHANFNGQDTFTYVATDAAGAASEGTVLLNVRPINDAPVAAADSFEVRGGTTLQIDAPGLLNNDADIDGDSLVVLITSEPRYGDLQAAATGAVVYMPRPGFTGIDGFTYRASDGHEHSADVAVHVAVEGRGVTFRGHVTAGVDQAAALGVDVETAAQERLFLASLATRPFRSVEDVSGLGLQWSRVRAHCASGEDAGLEIWMARGRATPGEVRVQLAGVAEHAILAVTQYSGYDMSDPLGTIAAANAAGIDGDCNVVARSAAYDLEVDTLTEGGVVFAAVSMRDRTHTTASGFIERSERAQGAGLDGTTLAISDRAVDAGTHPLGGRFDADVAWTVLALEVRSQQVPDERRRFTNALETWPNPFNAGLTLEFTLFRRSPVQLRIYDASGRLVRRVLDEVQPPGHITQHWDAHDDDGRAVSSGVYFVRMDLEGHALTRKVVLLK